MTSLRQKMIRELELQRKSDKTILAYVSAVAQLAEHYHRSPETISVEEIRSFVHHLIVNRKLAFSSCNQRVAAIRRGGWGRSGVFEAEPPDRSCRRVTRSARPCSPIG